MLGDPGQRAIHCIELVGRDDEIGYLRDTGPKSSDVVGLAFNPQPPWRRTAIRR